MNKMLFNGEKNPRRKIQIHTGRKSPSIPCQKENLQRIMYLLFFTQMAEASLPGSPGQLKD